MTDKRLLIFGEVLFDHFPDGERVLGGAPFNVAWHLQAFGQAPQLVSRVGKDEQGLEARTAMEDWGMDTRTLQTDPQLPTGRVDVRFEDNEPRYEILYPSAFDLISGSAASNRLETPIHLLYHGTLALRDETSRCGFAALRQYQPGLVFIDVNLRAPWWERPRVLELLRSADWVKLNTDELEELGGDVAGDADRAAWFLAEHGLRGLVLTDGENGAEILTAGGTRFCVKPEPAVGVVDTVGAGDALTAVILLGLLRQWPLEMSLQRAQSFASGICGRRGATVREWRFYHRFIQEWQDG